MSGPTTLRLTLEGRTYEVVIEDADKGKSVTVDGRRFDVTAARPSAGNAAVLVRVAGKDHSVERLDLSTVRVDGQDAGFKVESVQSGTAGPGVGASGARIHPPMPGRVVAVKVKVGDKVGAGDVLLVLEAMKMQNEVTSPAAGVVSEVKTQVGATVDTGHVLVVLGPPVPPAKELIA